MKKLCVVLMSLTISANCWSQMEPDNEMIELPIKMINGYIPFNPSFTNVSLDDVMTDSPWAGILVEVTGIPDEWDNAVVQPIWFDPLQLVYQGYKSGKLDEVFFNLAKEQWEMDISNLHPDPIKCFSHIVLHKLEDNSVEYMVDTDNDRDFSDEQIFKPNKFAQTLEELDSLSKHCHWLEGEIYVEGAVRQRKFPYYIKQDEQGVWGSFPHYAIAEFKDKLLLVSSGFKPHFGKSDVLIFDPNLGKVISTIIEKKEFISVDEQLYQNLGVDFGREILSIKIVNAAESDLVGTQVGLPAIPFSGTEFTTEKTIQLSDYKGKLLFVDFWGSWCGPCVSEIPKLKEVYEQLDKDQVIFLGIAQDDPKSLRSCIDKNEIAWEQILSTKDNNIVQQYNIISFPSSFLIDENGVIIAKDLLGEDLLETIEQHLKEHNKH